MKLRVAHLGHQQAGRGLPDTEEPQVALFSCETAALLAWTHYLLGARLDEASINEADLGKANLSGASLKEADLSFSLLTPLRILTSLLSKATFLSLRLFHFYFIWRSRD